jgi:hypothetical protein
MGKVRIRDLSDVPPPPPRLPGYTKQRFQGTDEFERHVAELHVGSAGEIELEADDDMRTLKTRLKRVSDRMKRPLRIWDVEGRLYFCLAEV